MVKFPGSAKRPGSDRIRIRNTKGSTVTKYRAELCMGRLFTGQIVYGPDCLRAQLYILYVGQILPGQIVQNGILWGRIMHGWIILIQYKLVSLRAQHFFCILDDYTVHISSVIRAQLRLRCKRQVDSGVDQFYSASDRFTPVRVSLYKIMFLQPQL